MKFVFASYVYTAEFNTPMAWLRRIRAYTGILEALSENHEVISIEQIDFEGECKHKGVLYYFNRYPSRLFPAKLHRFIKSQQPDIVVIQGMHFPLQVIQLRTTLGSNVKIIVHNHAEQPFTGKKKYLQRLANKYIDACLFASRNIGLDWVKAGNLGNPQKIHEVMEVSSVFYPVDRAIALEKTSAKGTPVFLWVGRLNQNKDPLNVVKAFLSFVETQAGARLYMIYHTDELLADIQSLLNGSTYKESVALIGRVPHEDLLYWYNSAGFILSGSYYEGSGTAVCEAMSCGCIPIVTDIFSFRMITDDGNCGMLYKPGDNDGLLQRLKQTIDLELTQKRKASLEYFKSNLSFNAIATRIGEIAASL